VEVATEVEVLQRGFRKEVSWRGCRKGSDFEKVGGWEGIVKRVLQRGRNLEGFGLRVWGFGVKAGAVKLVP
jgi:hypothetical protein